MTKDPKAEIIVAEIAKNTREIVRVSLGNLSNSAQSGPRIGVQSGPL